MIRNFCLDILSSGPIQRVGREKRHGAMAGADSSIYETGPGTNILKVHLISMRTLCVRYSRKTRSPSHFLVVKNFLKILPASFKFYLRKLTDEKFRHIV